MLIWAVVTCEAVWLMESHVCVYLCWDTKCSWRYVKFIHPKPSLHHASWTNLHLCSLAPSSSKSEVTTASKGTQSIVILRFGFNFAIWQCSDFLAWCKQYSSHKDQAHVSTADATASSRDQKHWCSPKVYQVSGVLFK
jgi:hypothetical protein